MRYTAEMATDPLRELREKITELENMDLDKLRARVQLFSARVDVEDLADRIAAETDADVEVVLLVVRAAWMTRLDEDSRGEDIPDPEAFKVRVHTDVRTILHALTHGETETGDPIANRCLQKALQLGKAGVKIIPVRQVLDRTRCMIGNRA